MSKFDLVMAGFLTREVHAGQTPDPAYGALATPIYQTSTFVFESAEQAVRRFNGEEEGYAYSRGGNPTVRAFEEKIANLEGGEDAVATGSGMGAVSSAVMACAHAGDHIVVSDCIYGCSNMVIREILPTFGVEVTAVNITRLDEIAAAIRPNTTVIYFETPSNPLMQVADIKAIAQLAEGKDIKVIVDNTFAPPPVQYPLALGADIVVHSATKYLNGHGDVLGGAVVGGMEDIALIRSRYVTKISGSTCSPFNAFLMLRGMQTLGLRMRQHCSSALKVAQYLEGQDAVACVRFPGLESSSYHELATTQMSGMYTGIMSFDMKEGIHGLSAFEAAKKLIDNLKLCSIAVSLGDPETLVCHPASTTHNNVPKKMREEAGITDGLVRLSVGLEDVEDVIADFEQAFAAL